MAGLGPNAWNHAAGGGPCLPEGRSEGTPEGNNAGGCPSLRPAFPWLGEGGHLCVTWEALVTDH